MKTGFSIQRFLESVSFCIFNCLFSETDYNISFREGGCMGGEGGVIDILISITRFRGRDEYISANT